MEDLKNYSKREIFDFVFANLMNELKLIEPYKNKIKEIKGIYHNCNTDTYWIVLKGNIKYSFDLLVKNIKQGNKVLTF